MSCGVELSSLLAQDGTHIAWTSSPTLTGSVYVQPKATRSQRLIAAGQFLPNSLSIDRGHVYWAGGMNAGFISRAPLDGGAVQRLVSGAKLPESAVADGDYVWLEGGTQEVRRQPLDGGPAILELRPSSLGQLIVDDTHLYFSGSYGVWRMAK